MKNCYNNNNKKKLINMLNLPSLEALVHEPDLRTKQFVRLWCDHANTTLYKSHHRFLGRKKKVSAHIVQKKGVTISIVQLLTKFSSSPPLPSSTHDILRDHPKIQKKKNSLSSLPSALSSLLQNGFFFV